MMKLGVIHTLQQHLQHDQCKRFEVKAKSIIITTQPPKTNNGDRKWIKCNSRTRNASKRGKLLGLFQLEQNLKYPGFELKQKIFLSENCNLLGVLNQLMKLKRITNGDCRQAVFVIFRKKKKSF